jgi:glycosyltransferase involved in cell wall biosynthesis
MSKFSIITTTYRHEKYIRSTIQSIIDQTSSDWELYIGDDSPDFLTWNVISEFVEKYPDKIHAWKHEESK